MEPYPFQLCVANHLVNGRSVVLQAPTGAGKTQAALLPYLDARAKLPPERFPRRCVYAVPMRVLANQFVAHYQDIIGEYSARFLPEEHEIQVRVQTGERAEDRTFEGDLIFTTIDQVLSNFLAIPYALSNGKANLNAAAVFGSYLVFDEFHLFPAENDGSGALGTTLEMLRWLQGITPFVLMTATFSDTMLDRLCALLGAVKVTLSDEELTALPSQQKTRRYQTVDAELTAGAVLDAHQTRSLAICNTVARAQALYRDLRADPRSAGVEIRLLHARFLKTDRGTKEDWARKEFGKDLAKRRARSAILVATQVIEVGLDISCENLHTELAPANSVLQRAGRCARYPGEVGDVRIYRLPVDEAGQPKTAPYLGPAAALCSATWDAFVQRSGDAFGYADELAIVNAVHTAHDAGVLDQLANMRGRTKGDMEAALGGPDRKVARGLARQLIRDVDNITVVVHPDPGERTVPDPWAFEGFGLFSGTVRGAVKALVARGGALGLDWAIRVPVALQEAENSREPTRYKWLLVNDPQEMAGARLVFVHPALAAYDSEIGFRFVVDDMDSSTGFCSPPLQRGTADRAAFSYVAESYQEHIGRLWQVHRRERGDEIAWVGRRLEARLGLPAGLVDRAVRLTLACHDVGKLTEDWQGWAHEWQRKVGDARPDQELLAHTFFDAGNPQHQTLDRALRGKRPPHAVEGAIAAAQLVRVALGEDGAGIEPVVTPAVVSAIARHHNAGSLESRAFRLDRYAATTLQEVLDTLRTGPDWRAEARRLRDAAPAACLTERMGLVRQGDTLGQLLYFLLVRVLRLSDEAAVALARETKAS